MRLRTTIRGSQAVWWGILGSILVTALVWIGGAIPASVPKLPDQGPFWYYWQLPQATFWGQATSWGMFMGHLLAIFGCIWWAKRQQLRYTTALQPINFVMLAINALFIILHFVQTYVWYDGLAQDVPNWTSQAAVVVLLVIVLIMETPRRGILFGKKFAFRQEFIRILRQYHGYLFSFAIIYTFWFHPMEATGGHLVGFFYTFLLLLQSALIFNRAHVNRWWTFALEFTVLPHGVMVAYLQGKGAWPMFLFGFAAIAVLTQIHGLGLGRWAKRLIYLAFVGSIIAVYGLSGRGWGELNEVLRIPAIDYLLIIVMYAIFWLFFGLMRFVERLRGLGGSSTTS